jgi:hypothetical protein
MASWAESDLRLFEVVDVGASAKPFQDVSIPIPHRHAAD